MVSLLLGIVQSGKYLLGEVTDQADSTRNGSEISETGDVGVFAVVGNGETATNGLQRWHGNVAEVAVVDKRKGATDGGEVSAGDGGELIAVETERTVDSLERRSRVNGDVTQSHVVGPDQVGENGRDVVAVGLDGQRCGDVTKLHVDLLEVVVVGDVNSVNNLEINTVEGVELSVLDVELRGSLDTSGERQTLESRKSVPHN